jgi:hypothetical protein
MWYRRNKISDSFDPMGAVEAWERAEGSPAPLGSTWVEAEKAWNLRFIPGMPQV